MTRLAVTEPLVSAASVAVVELISASGSAQAAIAASVSQGNQAGRICIVFLLGSGTTHATFADEDQSPRKSYVKRRFTPRSGAVEAQPPGGSQSRRPRH